MRKKMFGNLAVLILVIAGLMFMVSCAKKEVQSTIPEPPKVEVSDEDAAKSALSEDELARQAAEKLALEEEAIRKEKEAARSMFLNEDIFFDYDDASLKQSAREMLKMKAIWLRNNPDAAVVIEGHCDERGTTEYNLALGDRRAESTRSFLADLGINAARLEKISYGEEMPADRGHNEDAWAKNRRAHFTLK